MPEAFVYCWTDHKTNKLYVGSHKGDVNDGYVSSSKYMMEEYQIRPLDFTRQIIATGSVEDIRKLETKILKSMNAAADVMCYNKHNGFGNYLTEEIKQKISQAGKRWWNNLSSEDKKEWAKKSSDRLIGISKTESHKASMRGKRPNFNQSGSKNNNAKKINTPFGIFGSIKECAEITGIAYDNVHYKLRAKHNGWEYIT